MHSALRRMRTLFRVAPGLAGAAICVLGLLGLLIEEPYWRDVGHGPTWFTWTTWTVMPLTGPVALLARLAASAVSNQPELPFWLEHRLWGGVAIFVGRLLLGARSRGIPRRWVTGSC